MGTNYFLFDFLIIKILALSFVFSFVVINRKQIVVCWREHGCPRETEAREHFLVKRRLANCNLLPVQILRKCLNKNGYLTSNRINTEAFC